MRHSPPPGGTRLAQHSTRAVVLAVLATVAFPVAGLVTVAVPSAVVGFAVAAITVLAVVTLTRRVRLRRRDVRQVLIVRVPFTNTVLEL